MKFAFAYSTMLFSSAVSARTLASPSAGLGKSPDSALGLAKTRIAAS
ncbi:MAG: hypothetical protein J6X75_05220 [Clostridia bacterium]|nr:hypothetical protein [Clostridia bacterium]